MKNIFVLFSLILTINSFSQNIKGKVFNNDKTPLSGANIYYKGTTISTISDENGNFTLNYYPKSNTILVISFMGYQSQYFSNFDSSKDLNIELIASKNSLKEVVVNRKDEFSRKQKLKIFREHFLGATPNGKVALIENEEDIYFKYDKENFTLKAFSDKPLIIISPSLGYKIYYELQNFEVTFNNFSINTDDVVLSYYKGLSRFEEINNSNEILINRKKAYQGSQIHFFSNLANNIWSREQFLLLNDEQQVNANNCFKIYKQKDFIKVVVIKQLGENKNKNTIASYDILFDKKEESSIIFETDSFTIDRYGNNSNIENIIFSGKISEEKVGDMLPLNYMSVPEKIIQ
ncbi:MAG TPA: carboxypeptidase-like regulatory domain-containing protein [Flavobacterium sp.]|uniref:carboxypeptidase-like regulatory domain-containing protein n=1 Tax=Flavobacterium sp. TaxID=239 RepID=UPI002DB868FA|nr:carboxypeptidase-like regulatory domain-containing protein [Flavobacterium sp.]HEU4789843.1 carboxypeptidase-like regulatory domain-containing protein [Flavobacterium sp.]